MDYRKFYEYYFKLKITKNYVIHHIDFNRTNNNIDNLLLLPKELHQEYHDLLQKCDLLNWKSGELKVNTKITNTNLLPYTNTENLKRLIDVIEECNKWLLNKEELRLNIDTKKRG